MANSPIPPQIRAIFFDAVDTLIKPHPSVVDVYSQTGRKWGLEIIPDALARTFREAFRIEEKLDAESRWRVSEDRERERWKSIVSQVFAGSPAIDAIFNDLWNYFAKPTSWRVAESAGDVLRHLADRGFTLGLASNFDKRLNAIADELPPLSPLKLRVISSEVGWRKPSSHFFESVVRFAGCQAHEVLFIGDRRDTDYDGAIAAGLKSLLLDPQSRNSDEVDRIRSLAELIQ